MKKILLLFSFCLIPLYGGKNLVKSTPLPIVQKNHYWYGGVGFSLLRLKNCFSQEKFDAKAGTIIIGYRFSPYFAIEGRYVHDIGNVEYKHGINPNTRDISDYPANFTNKGFYLKTILPFKKIDMYALFGYGEVTLTNFPQGSRSRTEKAFQWGLGVAYNYKKSSFFFDYIRAYKGKGFDNRASEQETKAHIWSIGVLYSF